MPRYNLTRSLDGVLTSSGDLHLTLPHGILTVPKSLIPGFAVPFGGPFSVGQSVASPREPDLLMVVMQVGPVDFSGIRGYLCRVASSENDQRWFAETDLMASP